MSEELMVIGQMSVQDIVNRRSQVEDLMKSVMKNEQHYGTIPGCGSKPTLMQPGAQLLAQLFGFRAEYDISQKEMEGGHREYLARCKMFHGDLKVSEGVGVCSTMESKYRYRNAAAEIVWSGEPVPKVYWDMYGKDKQAAKEWLVKEFGAGAGTKKNDKGEWEIVVFKGGEGKVENPNIADVYNTCLKLAKKRSYVDATITATASSDFFTQDLEDIADNLKGATTVTAERVTSTPESKPKVAEEIKGWRDVVLHMGKTTKGKKLGDLQDGQVKAVKQYVEGLAKRSKEDDRLLAAIAMREVELSKSNPGAGNVTASRDQLFKLIDDSGISEDALMKVLKKNAISDAEYPADLSEEIAADCVAKWSKLLELVKLEEDQLPD